MSKKTLVLIISIIGAVQTALVAIFGALLPDDKKLLATTITSAVCALGEAICVALIKYIDPSVEAKKNAEIGK